jgi:aminopeptidase N
MGEREFLKESQYFERWGFDYHLYKPILDFARTNRVPVIALNTKREIIDKVSKNGIDSLSPEDKNDIPPDLDFSDTEYRSRLEEVFSFHEKSATKNFDYFYQSQILWDETMSRSIYEYLAANPERTMVVLAGQGHLMYGSGIPKRTFRRNGLPYSIILIDADVEKNIADYIFFPKPVEGETSPKLMVFLKKGKDGFTVAGFPDNSVSEKAGLKVGDILLYVDDVKVGSIDDIKIHLIYKKKGEIVRVKVGREEHGKRIEIEIPVEL